MPASARLGVMTVASGSRRSLNTFTPPGSNSSFPEVARSTGSSTTWGKFPFSNSSATTCALARVPSMPIFTPAMETSPTNSSSCARSTSAETGLTPRTPPVLWMVSAVMTATP